jgi:Diguanylate cyclase, GGDEF domain
LYFARYGGGKSILKEAAVTGMTATKAAHSRSGSTIRTIVVVVGVLLIFMWAAIALFIVSSRHSSIDDSRVKGRNLAIAFREEVGTLLRSADSDMSLIADAMKREGGTFDLYTWGQHNLLVSLGIARAIIIGPDGKLKSATYETHPGAVDLSDRDHFRVHLNDQSPNLYFGQTVVGRLAHGYVIPISRRVDAADGTFFDVLVVLIPPSSLTRLHHFIELGPQGVMTLTGLDHRVRARFTADSPDGTDGIGTLIPGPQRMDNLSENEYGSFTRAGVIDGITRIFTYSRVGSYPLIVTVGLGLDRELAAWRSSTITIVLLGLFAAVLLTGLAAYLIREIRIRAAFQSDLAHSAEHDFLTGLPNRMLLSDRVNQAIVLARRHDKTVAVLFLDLDGFKHINDSLGHNWRQASASYRTMPGEMRPPLGHGEPARWRRIRRAAF